MAEPVAQVLSERARRHAAAGPLAGLVAAATLHLAVLGLALVLPTLRQPSPPPEFVPVQIIPAQALGVERPRERREGPRAQAPAPEPPAPEPEPAPLPEPERPEPEPEPEDDRPALPDPEPEKKPEKKPERSETARKPPVPEKKPEKKPEARKTGGSGDRPSDGRPAQSGAEIPKGDEAARRGSAGGNPLGTSAFGSQIAGLEDPNFGYGYYIDRLLQLIDAQWNRPALGNEVRAVLHFRILRNGDIEDLRVAESSGYNSFDLAALRAVQNAAPFPALPASYRADSLGVNLIVR